MIVHPDSLNYPCDIADIEKMVQAWRGTPSKDVPCSVKIIADLLDIVKEAVREHDELRKEIADANLRADESNRIAEKAFEVVRGRILMEATYRNPTRVYDQTVPRDKKENGGESKTGTTKGWPTSFTRTTARAG